MAAPERALLGSVSSKITNTQTALEVASEAPKIFGGNGLTREYPLEKMLRDARAPLIEDGRNEVLAIKRGARCSSTNHPDLTSWARARSDRRNRAEAPSLMSNEADASGEDR